MKPLNWGFFIFVGVAMAVFIDVECYKNYFLFCAKSDKTGNVKKISKHNDSELDIDALMGVMKMELVSFNGNNYDLLIIGGALAGWSCAKLHELSNEIILGDKPTWELLRSKQLTLPKCNHIDLIEVAIGQASLKLYGGRQHTKKLQDLPIPPQSLILEEQTALLEQYCENDLALTELLYNTLKPKIDLRVKMKEKYGMDLRSKSDAQIAETIIKSELTKITNNTYSPKQYADDFSFTYKDPQIISFTSPDLLAIYHRLLDEQFKLSDKGSVQMPVWLAKQKIEIGTTIYQMGIGGLHSCEKSQYIKPAKGHFLSDFDVTSFYPSIILQQELYPESMGKDFLILYQSIVDRRIAAKRNKDDVESETLKIVLNGSYGKFGSRYSALYSPELLIQTTLTGQLSLLMLIEALESNGIKVISANTDGIVTYYSAEQIELLTSLLNNWMKQTTYNLEETKYSGIASRDVNNYLAVKINKEVKGKGCFAKPSLSKNPDGQIVYEAVINKIANNVPIRKTINRCQDITQFVTVRTVKGGAVWQDDYLGKAIRFYHSKDKALVDVPINYLKTGNKVPLSVGCRPLMDLPDEFPIDINYEYYIMKAEELLNGVGYA